MKSHEVSSENFWEQRTKKLNAHMTPSLGIEPRPHWWETLITAFWVAFFNDKCYLLLPTEQLQAYKQASIKHTQAKEELTVSKFAPDAIATIFRVTFLVVTLDNSETICTKYSLSVTLFNVCRIFHFTSTH